MITLTSEDVEVVTARNLQPGMVIPSGIVVALEFSGSGGNLWVKHSSGDFRWISSDKKVEVVARIDIEGFHE